MAEIVPAIIAKNFQELSQKIRMVEPYVNWVQLDIMDGIFAPEKTWNEPEELKNLNTNLSLEAHLMVTNPEAEIERWLNSGVKRILVHYESLMANRESLIANMTGKCKQYGIDFGVVLNLETPVDVLDDMRYAICDMQVIQLMSIAQIGYHGHPFDEKVIPKVRALTEKYPRVKIAVDGGIDKNSARKATRAGADILAVGSAVFNGGNIERAIKELNNISNV